MKPGLSIPSRLKMGAIVTLGLFVLAEIGAQLFAPTSTDPEPDPGGQPPIMLEGDPYLLWELRPGSRQMEGGTVTVNSLGFRSSELGPKTRSRVLVLGDSSVHGFGVDDSEVFTTHAAQYVDADFINAGVPGYSSTQALNLLRM
ncbi:MAG: hypothetical protein QGG40_16765, partial [Myxococcota bacterium]|nr:hypothetical protein [Myxococcota bacterium]